MKEIILQTGEIQISSNSSTISSGVTDASWSTVKFKSRFPQGTVPVHATEKVSWIAIKPNIIFGRDENGQIVIEDEVNHVG